MSATHPLTLGIPRGACPERPEERLSKFDLLGEQLGRRVRQSLEKLRKPWSKVPAQVEAQATRLAGHTDAELRVVAEEVRASLQRDGFVDDAVARAFALVREASSRVLGQRHYDVQLMGGWVMLNGMVAEMETGEGKTLVATLPACTAALAGVPVHVVTVNDYLTERDAALMRPLYEFLGLSVGTVLSNMETAERRESYRCDIAYCTNSQLVFDYLWDRITLENHDSRRKLQIERLSGRNRCEELIQQGLHFAIVDEADSVLVDEARTPLIISERGEDELEQQIYTIAVELARELERERDFEIDDRERRADLLEAGQIRLGELGEPHGGIWAGKLRRESLVSQALSALYCFRLDEHYLVRDDKVEIVDEYTGRVMPDRSWEHGLHQMIEVKEGVTLTGRQNPRARISYQRFFRRYLRLSGMTGTAKEVAGELASVYRLSVVRIPTNRPVQRKQLGETVLRTIDEKWDAVATRISEVHAMGRPILVGTRSVEASEALSARLHAARLKHEVINARQDSDEAAVVAAAGAPFAITVATNMAGRGTDIRLQEKVGELGGLHVIATDRHEARRIDRQLYGRCGRQGDPGSCESFVSLEDDLFATHATVVARRIADRALDGDARINRFAVRAALDQAQRAVETQHSRSRRRLFSQDQQLDSLLGFSGRPH